MPNPAFRLDFTARDKTTEVMDRIEGRFSKWNKTAQKTAKPLEEIDRTLTRIGKGTGLERFTRDFTRFGQMASTAAGGLEEATAGLGGIGEAAAAVGGPFTIAIAAAGAAAATVVTVAQKWDDSAATLGRFSKVLGDNAQDIQEWVGAGERAGLTADQTKASLMGLTSAIDATRLPGGNPAALGVLNSEGMAPPGEGPLDPNEWAMKVSAILQKQTDPLVQRRLASIFGISEEALPLYTQGPVAIAAEKADFAKTAHPLTQKQIDEGLRDAHDWAAMRQSIGGVGRSVGHMAATLAHPWVHPTGRAASALAGGLDTWSDVQDQKNAIYSKFFHGDFKGAWRTLTGADQAHAGTAAAAGRHAGQPAPDSQAQPERPAGRGHAGMTAAQLARAASIRDELSKALGLTSSQAAGLVSILQAESGLIAQNEHAPTVPGSRGGFGFAQWTNSRGAPTRRTDFEAWSAAHHMDVRSDAANIGYITEELTHAYAPVLARIKQARSAQEAANAAFNYTSGGAPGLEKDRAGHVRYAEAIAAARAQAAPTPPQQIEVTVNFANAPAGTSATAKASSGGKISLKIGHAMPSHN